MASARMIAKELSAKQRQLLIRHVDGSHPIRTDQAITLNALVSKGLVRFMRGRQRSSFITSFGRDVLIYVLAAMADQLASADDSVGMPPEAFEKTLNG